MQTNGVVLGVILTWCIFVFLWFVKFCVVCVLPPERICLRLSTWNQEDQILKYSPPFCSQFMLFQKKKYTGICIFVLCCLLLEIASSQVYNIASNTNKTFFQPWVYNKVQHTSRISRTTYVSVSCIDNRLNKTKKFLCTVHLYNTFKYMCNSTCL